LYPLNPAAALALALATGACAPNMPAMGASYDGSNPTLSVAAPEMAPARKVSEQDCSRPVESMTDNLRCK
jgi:hypothetical protein